jgi:hypothetical protein
VLAASLSTDPRSPLFPVVGDRDSTALAAGYFNTLGFTGAFCASLGFGYLVDRVQTFAAGWLFLGSITVVGVCAALTLRIPHSIGRDHS